jgi:hypothetical protein
MADNYNNPFSQYNPLTGQEEPRNLTGKIGVSVGAPGGYGAVGVDSKGKVNRSGIAGGSNS